MSPARPWRARSAPRRAVALVVVAVVAGTLLPLVPRPALAVERSARVDLHRPALVDAGAITNRLRGSALAPFEMIGLSYRGTGEPRIRVRTATGWTSWEDLAAEPAEAPDAAEATPAGDHVTEPVWVGSATAYEVAVPRGTTAVRAHLVRESTTRVQLRWRESTAEGAPRIRMRSAWGARPPKQRPTIANRLKLAVVHHTGEAGQSYSSAQVPRIIRGIQAYHMDVRGWNDIAYPFVIDRFGRIWEGRAGGIAKAVVGGHSRGFNTRSTGVVVLGNFDRDALPGPAVSALRVLLGWKLFVHGLDPRATVRFTSFDSPRWPAGTTQKLPAILGHARIGATACPGDRLQEAMSSIRRGAGSRFDGQRGSGTFTSSELVHDGIARPLPGDFNGDGRGDVLWYGAGDEADSLWLGRADGSFATRSVTITRTFEPVLGDFDHDGRTDVFWYGAGAAADRVWYGLSDGTFWVRAVSMPGFHRPVAGDFDGDLRTDIIWYGRGDAADRLWLGASGRTFESRPIDVSRSFDEPIVGDFNDDDRADVLWYGRGAATDRLWLGRADGRFVIRGLTVGLDARPFVGDFGGGEGTDIFWYGPGSAADRLWISDVSGAFSARGMTAGGDLRPVVADVDGGGRDDIYWHGPGLARDRLWLNDGSGGFAKSTQLSLVDAVPYALDGNGDGRDDVLLTRAGAATELYLRAT